MHLKYTLKGGFLMPCQSPIKRIFSLENLNAGLNSLIERKTGHNSTLDEDYRFTPSVLRIAVSFIISCAEFASAVSIFCSLYNSPS